MNQADTAWMLVSTALVLLMTPALGLFYCGLVREKNTLNPFMMCIAALGVATITWALVGYSLAFDEGNAIIGGLDHALQGGEVSGAGLRVIGVRGGEDRVAVISYRREREVRGYRPLRELIVERMAARAARWATRTLPGMRIDSVNFVASVANALRDAQTFASVRTSCEARTRALPAAPGQPGWIIHGRAHFCCVHRTISGSGP